MMVDGEVVAVNNSLESDCSLVNQDAHGKGWMIEVKIRDPAQLNDLLTEEEYKEITH